MRIVSLALVLNIVLWNVSQGQEKCATVPYMKNLTEKKGPAENPEQFEQWLKNKIEKRKQTTSALRAAVTYQVPVVIHVVHNGQSIGVGQNLSDEQIISQITVLNDDFKRLNADKVNTPAAFEPAAGSFDVEFVLAKSDPDGLPTTGIVRVNGEKTSWSATSESEMADLKSKSYWPSDDYLNIWVTDLSGFYLGLAQYPVSTLPGLEAYQDGIAETDGVVIDFTVFGLGSSDPVYDLGRTTTHEIGHFFGLRHIWGDETNCAGSDYVDDTPNQGNATTTCPSGVRTDACTASSPGIMYQNFMDYTDDACMNLFTQGQVERMIAVIENCERRVSLLNSPGLVAPSGLGEDLKITAITSPSPVTCSSAALKFTIQNLGSPVITKFKVNYLIDDAGSSTENFENVTIGSGASMDVTLPITLQQGEHSLYIKVHSPNGFTDTNADNSDTLIHILVNDNADIIPLLEKFDNSSSNWTVFNPTDGTLWADTETNFSNSSYFKAFNNPQIGEQSWLVSPVLDFSSIESASIQFDYSYRYATGGNKNDRLKILASVDCGNTFTPLINTPFDKSGQNLSDIPKNSEWFPNDESEWETDEYVNLNELTGNAQVRLAFVAENRNGNNIFVDNIEFFVSDNPRPYNIGSDPFGLYYDLKLVDNEWVMDFSHSNILLNLTERQQVNITVLDIMGRVLIDYTIQNGLNQTTQVPIGLSAAGLYLIRLRIGVNEYVTKTYIAP